MKHWNTRESVECGSGGWYPRLAEGGRGGGEGWPPPRRGQATAEARPRRRPAASGGMRREREGMRRDCRDSPARGTEGEGGRRCGLTGEGNGGGGAAGAPPWGASSPRETERDRMGRVLLFCDEEGSGLIFLWRGISGDVARSCPSK